MEPDQKRMMLQDAPPFPWSLTEHWYEDENDKLVREWWIHDSHSCHVGTSYDSDVVLLIKAVGSESEYCPSGKQEVWTAVDTPGTYNTWEVRTESGRVVCSKFVDGHAAGLVAAFHNDKLGLVPEFQDTWPALRMILEEVVGSRGVIRDQHDYGKNYAQWAVLPPMDRRNWDGWEITQMVRKAGFAVRHSEHPSMDDRRKYGGRLEYTFCEVQVKQNDPCWRQMLAGRNASRPSDEENNHA